MDYSQMLQRRRERLFGDWSPMGLTGLEIGPLSRPVVTKTEANIFYVDHCSTEDIREKYRGHDHVDGIVDIDFIWRDQPLSVLLAEKTPLDFIIAAHVIEHVPDLRGWLGEVADCLRVGGSLFLIVPDKRFTFDIFRRPSSYEEVLLAYSERRRRPGLRVVLDHFSNVCSANTWEIWEDYSCIENIRYCHGPEFLNLAHFQWHQGKYIDVHSWVFTPWHFFDLLGKMTRDLDLKFNIGRFLTTQKHDLEFYVELVKTDVVSTDFDCIAKSACKNALWPAAASPFQENLYALT